jgi:hypothetical protein
VGGFTSHFPSHRPAEVSFIFLGSKPSEYPPCSEGFPFRWRKFKIKFKARQASQKIRKPATKKEAGADPYLTLAHQPIDLDYERKQMRKQTIKLTEEQYDWYGEDVGWRTDVIYQDEMGSITNYFYSPDSIGRIWHDTLKEMYDYVFLPDTPIIVVRRKGNYE